MKNFGQAFSKTRVARWAAKDSTNSSKIASNVIPQHLEMKIRNCAISDCTASAAKENATLHRRNWSGECITTSSHQAKKATTRSRNLPQRESRWRFATFWKSRRLLP